MQRGTGPVTKQFIEPIRLWVMIVAFGVPEYFGGQWPAKNSQRVIYVCMKKRVEGGKKEKIEEGCFFLVTLEITSIAYIKLIILLSRLGKMPRISQFSILNFCKSRWNNVMHFFPFVADPRTLPLTILPFDPLKFPYLYHCPIGIIPPVSRLYPAAILAAPSPILTPHSTPVRFGSVL
ncbi:hypothetical protein F4774DRAFT_171502 [Daldinia eschscholtzii]|nr:hypothetical protein F4774DRAFT_171502 [Daldinia eschscholtzii]